MATAAFGIITNSTNQILLVKLAESFRNAHMWNFPGGVIENGEAIQSGLEREILEETNTKVVVTEPLDTFDTEDPENTIHIFKCSYISGTLKYQPEELEDVGWFSYAEALKLPLAFNIKNYIEQLQTSYMEDAEYKYSAGGVVLKDNKALLIFSKSRNSVGLPKGTIDEGESAEQAAIREVKEETGYDVAILEKIGDYTYEFDWTDGKHHIKTVSYFSMKLINDTPPTQNLQPGEDFVTEWMELEEAMKVLTYDDTKDAVGRVLI